jgi:hypothetical protein
VSWAGRKTVWARFGAIFSERWSCFLALMCLFLVVRCVGAFWNVFYCGKFVLFEKSFWCGLVVISGSNIRDQVGFVSGRGSETYVGVSWAGRKTVWTRFGAICSERWSCFLALVCLLCVVRRVGAFWNVFYCGKFVF